MGITAISGPHVVYGITQTSSGAVTEYNEERGPSLYDLGSGFLDPRAVFNYGPGDAVGTKLYGIFDPTTATVDYIPFAADSSAIHRSTTEAPVAGTALTLTPTSSVGSILTTIVAPETGLTVSVIALDSTAATLNFGQGGTIAIWNPAGGTGRVLSVINTSNTNTEQYIINGRDMYGLKMTETILASTTSTGTGVGKKAFKYISTITPSTATTISATGVRVGMVDIFGFPTYTRYLAATTVITSTTALTPTIQILSSVSCVLGSTVAVAVATSPDARGTVASTAATNGTSATIITGDGSGVRITITQQISATMASNITASSQTSIFGLAQFSAV